MPFKKTEIEIILFLINEIRKKFSKKKIFKIDGIVKAINKEIKFKENRIAESTLKRLLDFEKTPSNIGDEAIYKLGNWFTEGNFASLDSIKNRYPKAFDNYIEINKRRHDIFFETFKTFKIEEEVEKDDLVDVFSFKIKEVKEYLKKQESLSIPHNVEQNRSEQKKTKKNRIIFSFIGIVILMILTLFLNQYFSTFNNTFQLSIKPNLSLHSDYPKLSKKKRAVIKFYLPTGIQEKEINRKNEVVLTDLPYRLLGEKIKTELEDKFWKLSKDSIILKNGFLVLNIEPNESLSKIDGKVLTHVGGLPIENAKVHIENIEVKTNAQGIFSLTIPIEKRRIQYELSIYKEGYRSFKMIYFSGTTAQVRLFKNS